MENELKTNAVHLNPEGQYGIRKSIVRLVKNGKSNEEIAAILDVSERHVRAIKKAYAENGIAWIKPKK
jgi:transposase